MVELGLFPDSASVAGGELSVGSMSAAELAAEFDAVHTVERAKRVGSIEEIIPARTLRPYLIETLLADLERLNRGS